jgi:hypothetical protein
MGVKILISKIQLNKQLRPSIYTIYFYQLFVALIARVQP